MVTDVVEEKGKQVAGEKEARKRTWRRGHPQRTLQSGAWTLREFGGKTVWDWMQLLIVPIALSLITVGFAWQQNNRQHEIENQRAKSDRKIEEQRAQDAALQAYLDQMSQLMLEGDLRSSEANSEVRTLARARTQTVLAQLNSDRKGSVVQFLYEASLINKDHPVVSLSDIGLRGADLSQLDLNKANLSGAELHEALLSGITLSDADLSEADLPKADLSSAILSGANLSEAELPEADLSAATLTHADLGGADLSSANLSGYAVLTDADLSEADLPKADLRDADLSGVDLRDADLSGANLRDATGVTEEQLEKQAQTLKGATMPNGSIHD